LRTKTGPDLAGGRPGARGPPPPPLNPALDKDTIRRTQTESDTDTLPDNKARLTYKRTNHGAQQYNMDCLYVSKTSYFVTVYILGK